MRVLHPVLLGTVLGTSAGPSPQLKRLMPRAMHLAVPLLAKSVALAASVHPAAAAGASHYSGLAGLAVPQATRGTEGAGRGKELHTGPRRGRM